MSKYYVNNEAETTGTGEHEVHAEGCHKMPGNRTYLGEFSSCRDAVSAAKRYHSNVDGCFHCSRTCHTR